LHLSEAPFNLDDLSDRSQVVVSFGLVAAINTLVVGEKVALPENPNWQEDFGKATAGTINSSITLENSTSASSSQTLTDTVSRSLMANYLVLKQNIFRGTDNIKIGGENSLLKLFCRMILSDTDVFIPNITPTKLSSA
jgi:hypothetical protein